MRQLKPQKARGALTDDIWDSPEWIAERKYDGFRMLAHIGASGVRFTSGRLNVEGRYTERTAQLPHLAGVRNVRVDGKPIPFHDRLGTLTDTVLDGEIIPSAALEKRLIKEGGGHSKAVGSIVNSSPPEAVAKQMEHGWCRYVAFDVLFHDGRDVRGLPLTERRAILFNAVAKWSNPYVSVPDAYLGGSKRRWYERIVAAGGEGVVLKHMDHRYGDERLWVKVKRESSADVVVMGFEAAKEATKKKGSKEKTEAKYAGLVGAILCGQFPSPAPARAEGLRELVQVARVSGFDDVLRAQMTEKPNKFLGLVLKIKHNGREPTGRFRHPRFGEWRPDKNPKDCVIDMEER